MRLLAQFYRCTRCGTGRLARTRRGLIKDRGSLQTPACPALRLIQHAYTHTDLW
jgi:hypothetical protein